MEKEVSSVFTRKIQKSFQIQKASGVPSTMPPKKEMPETNSSSRSSLAPSCLAEAPSAIRIPVSLDLYFKNRAAAYTTNTPHPKTARKNIIDTCLRESPPSGRMVSTVGDCIITA